MKTGPRAHPLAGLMIWEFPTVRGPLNKTLCTVIHYRASTNWGSVLMGVHLVRAAFSFWGPLLLLLVVFFLLLLLFLLFFDFHDIGAHDFWKLPYTMHYIAHSIDSIYHILYTILTLGPPCLLGSSQICMGAAVGPRNLWAVLWRGWCTNKANGRGPSLRTRKDYD